MEIVDEKNTDALYKRAAEKLLEKIAVILNEQGRCVLGIVGGRTVPRLFKAVLEKANALKGTIHVFWLDERVSNEKNFVSALPYLEQLSQKIATEWHPLTTMHQQGMEEEMNKCLDHLAQLSGGPSFDIVVLSAGEDGHIASLFPRSAALMSGGTRYVLVENAPKPPPLRVTVTAPLLLTAREAFLFFAGSGKKHAYEQFKDPDVSIEECPAKLLQRVPLHVYTALQ